ncbi:DNA polymerase III subunit gamma/tau [Butyrivibrio sp. NC3005]|uniref:DNA polymerase III subunit gamma/tau n=1 Tax=Butyrivibrio sp. NC3005 TaxID=1280685 RepID=UPI0003F50C8B|nr:DNA polymerase III subunit gamma/tau [Butyrivibrio sp. NC3005]
MAYVALYRKFRPPTFEDVKGQDHIVTTLKNQIMSDRVGHAYLFCGTRGTGKTSVAKILSRAVNCENPHDGNPCGECETCRAIAEGRCVDVVEIDAASNNGVENIRTIIDEVSYSPTMAKKKVYIIDEVHMLSTGAFNALLKTLEEPPEYTIFILATTEVQKIPITILSRCQRYDFHRITIDTIEDRLKEVTSAEKIDAEEKALRYIARVADGSMRDSLSLLDQCIAFNFGETLTYDKVLNVLGAVDTSVFNDLFEAIYNADAESSLKVLADVVIKGRELTQFVNDFVWYLRNLMLIQTADNVEDVIDISSDNLVVLKEVAKKAQMNTIMRYISVFSELSSNLRFATQKRILIEMTLIRLCRPQSDKDSSEALEDRIRLLEDYVGQTKRIMKQLQNGEIAVSSSKAEGVVKEDKGEPLKLDRAVPDDIKKVVENFRAFADRIKDAALRSYIRADRPRLSMSSDNKLQLVFSNEVRGNMVLSQKDVLEKELAEYFQKEVPVEIKSLAKGEKFNTSYVDLESNLSAINFDIVTEDEEIPPETIKETARQEENAVSETNKELTIDDTVEEIEENKTLINDDIEEPNDEFGFEEKDDDNTEDGANEDFPPESEGYYAEDEDIPSQDAIDLSMQMAREKE